MAGDIQEPTARRPTDSKPQRADSHGGTMPPTALPSANALPGGGQNTAGSKNQEASLLDAAKSIQLSDFKEVHKKPCVRDALMTGMGAGFGIGASVMASCNWAVGSFCFGSFLMYEFCQRKRLLELHGMKRAVEVMDRKHGEKKAKAGAARAAARNANEAS